MAGSVLSSKIKDSRPIVEWVTMYDKKWQLARDLDELDKKILQKHPLEGTHKYGGSRRSTLLEMLNKIENFANKG